jgi:hypothetical protein
MYKNGEASNGKRWCTGRGYTRQEWKTNGGLKINKNK